MASLDKDLKTRTGSGEAAQVRRRRAVAPAEPGGRVQPSGLHGGGGRYAGDGALILEGCDLWRHGAQSDALMQASSSAVMQVAETGRNLQQCKPMTTAASIRTWLQETLAETGVSVKQWAKSAGVAESTIHRALKPDYQYVTSNRTISKLASALGVSAPQASTTEPQMVGAEFLPIRYDVGAGLWQEITDSQVFIGVGTVAPDPAYSGFPQWLERVQGDSMDQDYRDGELVHVVDAIALGYAPQHGDHVILVRRRADGAEMERTIKEVVRTSGGPIEFWPRSTNPRWAKPIILNNGVQENDQTTEVEIAALVIGSYRPRRR